MRTTWTQALSWRLERQLLEPVGDLPLLDVVGRLVAVPAQHQQVAELVVRARRTTSSPGEVPAAWDAGDLVCVFAWRGATHLMRPADAAVHLALRASSRMWELASWREHYRLEPQDWPPLLDAVRTALADGPVTVTGLGAAITAGRRFRHLRATFEGDPWTLLKAMCWQGVLGLGPALDGHVTVRDLASSRAWPGAVDLADAGPAAVETYVRAFGPVTQANLRYWIGEGLGAGRHLRGWLKTLADRLVEVEVDGEKALFPADLVDTLVAARPSVTVRLLAASDPWLLGPGTADAHLVPPARRALFSAGAAPVLVGGVVAGTWAARGARLDVTWFAEAGAVPGALADEAARLGGLLGRDLDVVVHQDA